MPEELNRIGLSAFARDGDYAISLVSGRKYNVNTIVEFTPLAQNVAVRGGEPIELDRVLFLILRNGRIEEFEGVKKEARENEQVDAVYGLYKHGSRTVSLSATSTVALVELDPEWRIRPEGVISPLGGSVYLDITSEDRARVVDLARGAVSSEVGVETSLSTAQHHLPVFSGSVKVPVKDRMCELRLDDRYVALPVPEYMLGSSAMSLLLYEPVAYLLRGDSGVKLITPNCKLRKVSDSKWLYYRITEAVGVAVENLTPASDGKRIAMHGIHNEGAGDPVIIADERYYSSWTPGTQRNCVLYIDFGSAVLCKSLDEELVVPVGEGKGLVLVSEEEFAVSTSAVARLSDGYAYWYPKSRVLLVVKDWHVVACELRESVGVALTSSGFALNALGLVVAVDSFEDAERLLELLKSRMLCRKIDVQAIDEVRTIKPADKLVVAREGNRAHKAPFFSALLKVISDHPD